MPEWPWLDQRLLQIQGLNKRIVVIFFFSACLLDPLSSCTPDPDPAPISKLTTMSFHPAPPVDAINIACHKNRNKHSSFAVYMRVCVCAHVPWGCKLLGLSLYLHLDLLCISSSRCVWVKHQYLFTRYISRFPACTRQHRVFHTESWPWQTPATLHLWAAYLQTLQFLPSGGRRAFSFIINQELASRF